jgi:hypothetical protein
MTVRQVAADVPTPEDVFQEHSLKLTIGSFAKAKGAGQFVSEINGCLVEKRASRRHGQWHEGITFLRNKE